MKRTVPLFAILPLLACLAAPCFAQGPYPQTGNLVAAATPAPAQHKSHVEVRPSGITATSGASARRARSGISIDAPIETAVECSSGACPDLAIE